MKSFSAFKEILDGEKNDFEHVFTFYDQVMQGDSSYADRELYLTFIGFKILCSQYNLSFGEYLYSSNSETIYEFNTCPGRARTHFGHRFVIHFRTGSTTAINFYGAY